MNRTKNVITVINGGISIDLFKVNGDPFLKCLDGLVMRVIDRK